MKAKTPDPQMNLYSFSMKLEHICNHSNEIYQLANRIDWSVFEDALSPLFCEDNGRPTKSIRLVVGLQILKAVFTESDENVVEKWLQNPYWQYFCGEVEFQHEFPLDPSSIGKWRKRIKKEGFEKILEASIDAALKTGTVTKRDLTHVNVDTTVLEKAVAFPTDAKLYHKMRENLVAEADRLNVKLRQTYIRKSKKALIMVGRYAHARQMKRSNASLRSVKVYFGRVLRDLDRKTKAHQDEKLKSMLELGYRLFKQKRDDKNKIYSIHAPEVECIAKGKSHKKYEFGCKTSFVTSSKGNLFLSAQALHGNPFDGHTLKDALKNAETMIPKKDKIEVVITHAFVDQGYKGHGVDDVDVTIVGRNQKTATPSLKRWMKRRAAIEPLIGHAKNDGGTSKNQLKGKEGDQIQALMMAIGFNFRKVARHLALQAFFAFIKLMKILWDASENKLTETNPAY